MRVGITGASGFIGSTLAQHHIDRGDDVRALARGRDARRQAGVRYLQGDLGRPDDSLRRFADGLDVLYHCAAEIANERHMELVNVGGTTALLAAATGCIGRWVQLSSVGVYGRGHGEVSEESPVDPRNLYEATKARADKLVMSARAANRLASAVVLRPSIVFGKDMPNQSLVQMIGMIERGYFFFIGRPGASANYVHVSNVVDALVMCGQSTNADGRVYNLSDWCTIEDFVWAIADALGRRRPRLRFPEWPVRRAVRLCSSLRTVPLTGSRVDALVSRTRYPIDRIRCELSYVLRVPIARGLAGTVVRGVLP